VQDKSLITYTDPDGNSMNLAWSARDRSDTDIELLIDRLKQGELSGSMGGETSVCLLSWTERNMSYAHDWPVNVLFERIRQVADRAYIDKDEPRELCELLLTLGDGKAIRKNLKRRERLLGLDDPSCIRFQGKFFALSGRFAYGTNWQCAHEIRLRGGRVQSSPNQNTHYLVLGLMESLDALHPRVKTDLNHVRELRGKGRPIRVISETRWTEELVS